MEVPAAPRLVWTDAFLETCPLSGGPVESQDVVLEVLGLDLGEEDLEMGWSEKAGCHYGFLQDLFEMAEEAGLPPFAIQGFRVDEEPVEAAVFLSGPGVMVPWKVIAAQMAESLGRAQEPPPTPAEVRKLRQLDETWELGTAEVDVTEIDGKMLPLHLVLVADVGGLIRSTLPHAGAVTAEALATAVLKATQAQPRDGLTAGRPVRVRIADAEADVPGLRRLLKNARIGVEVGPTPLADEATADFLSKHGGEGGVDVPLLADVSDDDLQALLGAARDFYDAAPWTRLRGDRYLAFRLDDGPWLYASVMGQADEQHGLALFDDWLTLCRFVHTLPPFLVRDWKHEEALDAVGPAEGLTLYPAGVLHPEDAERLRAAGPPVYEGMYPLAARFTADGIGPSGWPPDVYTALLRAVPEVVAKRRAATITSIKADVKTPEGTLSLRYPARGTEALAGREKAVELVVDGAEVPEDVLPMTPLLAPDTLRVAGPADTRMSAVDRAVRGVFSWAHVRAVVMDGHVVWLGDSYADDPAPTLDDLAGARAVSVMFGAEVHPARVRRLPGPVDDVTAEVVAG